MHAKNEWIYVISFSVITFLLGILTNQIRQTKPGSTKASFAEIYTLKMKADTDHATTSNISKFMQYLWRHALIKFHENPCELAS